METDRQPPSEETLCRRCLLRPPPGLRPRVVAGADSHVARDGRACGAVVLVQLESGATVERTTAILEAPAPYVPGQLARRELPVLVAAWERLERRPDVLLFDGHGTAHPRGFGLACEGGLRLGLPAVGCAKTSLVGRHDPPAPERGAWAPVRHGNRVVGAALRTRSGVRPVYVSPGHLIDLETAVSVVLDACAGYRIPEPLRRADRLCRQLAAEIAESS